MVDTGDTLFKLTCLTYAGALGNYIGTLASTRKIVERAATWLAVLGLALHSSWLLHRWWLTGSVELAKRIEVGDVPTGIDKLYVLISHPPYTNLYESLIFVSWCLMVFYMVVEQKWQLKPIGIGAVGITLVAMFQAFIVTEKAARPLVPALQSYWILIHVWFLFLSYALFLIAAFSGLLFLIKVGTTSSTLGKWLAGSAAAVIALTSGLPLFTRAAFGITPSAPLADGHFKPVFLFPPGAQKGVKLFVDIPGAGPLLLAALVLLVVAAFLLHRESRDGKEHGFSSVGIKVLLGAAAASALGFGLAISAAMRHTPAEFPAGTIGALAQGVDSSQLVFHTNANYGLGLIGLVVVLLIGFAGLVGARPRLATTLPDEKRLDDVTYKVIVAGFPLLSIGIVLGAMWAYEAWGRYWGWDPKETWALITWFVYAIYLHTRITLGWTGKPGAALAVSGFAVVIFCYMGVNLGLTGEGLHTYGAG